jgi:hypothetical protein
VRALSFWRWRSTAKDIEAITGNGNRVFGRVCMRYAWRIVMVLLLLVGSRTQAKDAWSKWVELDEPLSAIPFKEGEVASIEFDPGEDCQAKMVINSFSGSVITMPLDVLQHPFEYLMENGLGLQASCNSYGDVFIRVKGMFPPEKSTHI